MKRQIGPRTSSEQELKKFGVTIVDASHFWLECDNCKRRWSPNILTGGRMPKGYWVCPDGCNAPAD